MVSSFVFLLGFLSLQTCVSSSYLYMFLVHFLWLFFFYLLVLILLSYFLDASLYFNEKERTDVYLVGGKEERSWEELGEGKE